MYEQWVAYKESNNGSIDIPKMTDDEKDDPVKKRLDALRGWCRSQIQHQHRFAKGYSDAGCLTGRAGHSRARNTLWHDY